MITTLSMPFVMHSLFVDLLPQMLFFNHVVSVSRLVFSSLTSAMCAWWSYILEKKDEAELTLDLVK